ncbi:MAG: hypothetical protein CALGDGBN_03310 [Pseudomonadales bacterium]|nr:hypothetical protein [Pseudomonadales bacterium]
MQERRQALIRDLKLIVQLEILTISRLLHWFMQTAKENRARRNPGANGPLVESRPRLSIMELFGKMNYACHSLLSDARKSVDENNTEIEKWARKVRTHVGERREEKRIEGKKKADFIDAVVSTSDKNPVPIFILGGAKWDQLKGRKQLLSYSSGSLRFSDPETLLNTHFPLSDIYDVEISGPGTVTRDAGMIGGGFGAGAIGGIAIASIVNILTTHTNTKTIIRISGKDAEVVMLSEELDLNDARIFFSEAYLAASRQKRSPTHSNLSEQLLRLKEMKDLGDLSDDEFSMAKRKLIESHQLVS